MATIEKRQGKDGKPSFRVVIRLKGHPAARATFDRKTDAKEWAQLTEAAIKEGRYFKTPEAKKRTLDDLITRYKTEELPKLRSDHQKRDSHLTWWSAKLGKYHLIDITPAKITQCRNTLLAEPVIRNGVAVEGSTKSPATTNRYLATLSAAFSCAVKDWGWLDDNPVLKVRKPQEPKGRLRFLSDTERTALLTACWNDKNCPALYPVVLMALSTGGRLGEIMGLEWRDIDFRRRLVIFRDTKNGESRSVPISRRAFEILDGMRKVRRIDCVLVFPNEEGTGPARIRNAWNKAVADARLSNFKFHDLRHTAASYLAMEGATLLEIAEILGHKTLAMVKRYAHLTEGHTRNVLERMADRQLGDKEEKKPGRRGKGGAK